MCKETVIRGIPQNSKGLGFIFLKMVKLITALFLLSWGMCLITSAFGVSGCQEHILVLQYSLPSSGGSGRPSSFTGYIGLL